MNIPGPAHYIQKLRARELPSQRTEILTREQALLELLFVRTRVASGFSFEELAPYLDSGVRERMVAVAHELRVSGLLTASNDVQLSAAGFLFADEVIKKLVESLN